MSGLTSKTSVAVIICFAAIGSVPCHAQTTTTPKNTPPADLLLKIEEMQRELTYLRQRDAQRQAWESSVVEQLPEVGPSVTATAYSLESPNCESSTPECRSTSCGCANSCGCGNCCSTGFCSCLCPPKEAPCIDCPRVSTLNPYFNVHFFGALKLDMLFNGPRPISPGTPYFLSPDSLTGLSQNTFDIHARQTNLNAAFTGPAVGCFQSGGLATFVLYNDNVIADKYGVLPMQAWGDLKNEDWRFAAGLQFDVFNSGTPTVLPFSALSGSGNSGDAFRGQLRVERFLHPNPNTQWTIQTALSEPIPSSIDPAFRISEDNGWPNVEGRVALGLGPLEGAGAAAARPIEVGVSGVIGQIRTTPLPPDPRVVSDVWGLGADARWKMTDCFGLRGELYTGQTLGTYNAGILQTISDDTLLGVRSSGAWLETYFYWTPCLHSHIGYGIDDPVDRDVTVATGRVRNETYFGNVIWDITTTFRIGFELTWRETAYQTLPDNQGAGFHTQFQWAF